MAIKLKNNASTTLAVDITPTDTSLNTTLGSVFPTLSNGEYFYATIANSDNTVIEIVKVRSISANILSVERGVEGTTASSFSADDIIEQRATVQTLKDFITKRIYLDEIIIGYTNIPVMSESKLLNVAKRDAPRLMEKWDSYFGPLLKNVILDKTNNVILEDGIIFPTVVDISKWLSINFSANTPTLVMKPYEIVNNAIPTMTKMYGMNRFFSSLKGRRGNGLTKSTIEVGIMDSVAKDSVFNAVHNVTTSHCTDKVFWVANNKKNMYSTLHKDGKIIHSTTGGGSYRGEYTVASDSFNDLTIGTDFKRRSLTPKEVHMDHSMNITVQDLPLSAEVNDDKSRLLAYPLERADGLTWSIMLKPIGMDCFVMDFPDFANYTLEAVAYNDTIQSSTKIKTFTGPTDFLYSDFDYSNGKMRIDVFNFRSLFASVTQISNNDTYNDWTTYNTIRFRLRDKISNEISELSNFGIIYDARHKFGTYRFMVKNYDK